MINFIGSPAQTGHTTITTKSQQKTGYEGDNDILKNIYDLEGNNFEWTAQAGITRFRVYRGGFYDDASDGYFRPASAHNYGGDPNYTSSSYTARLSLYL